MGKMGLKRLKSEQAYKKTERCFNTHNLEGTILGKNTFSELKF